MKNNRRDFLKIAGMAGIGFTGVGIVPALGADLEKEKEIANAAPDLQVFNRFPRMMQNYIENNVIEIGKKSAIKRASLKTKKDAEAYVRDVQSKIAQCLGPWPEKTPLNARNTGILDRDTYIIEKIIFDSRPGFPITANLYIPKGKNQPLPAIIGTCGHSDAAKAEPVYQSFAQGLARQGYVVLIFDPIGQGERVQFLTKGLKPKQGIGVKEHNYAGKQMMLNGESLSSWFTWDCMRCVDYLLSRKEVDPKQIGVTGNSGGGTQATWFCGADPRLAMAAPSCFVVGFETNLKNELPADIEQCPPAAISLGLDHLDFIAAMAPKPVILLGQEKDFFDVRGGEKIYSELKNIYKLLGAEENIQFFAGPDYHGFTKPNREAMYAFFNKVTKISDSKGEPLLKIEEAQTLLCTPAGQIGGENPRTVASFSEEISKKLSAKRGTVAGEELKKVLKQSLKMPVSTGIPEYRILRSDSARQYPKKYAANYAVDIEPGVLGLVCRLSDEALYSRVPNGYKRAILYVSHLSADHELREEAFLKELISAEPNSAVFACDVRGIGESQPNTCGNDFFGGYGNDYFYTAYSSMLDRPYVGQKTFDILRIIEWLKSCGHDEIHLVGKGWGAIPATFAAVLSDSVKQVTLKNALTSYTDIAENEEFNWPISSFVPGVLKHFDLPDCYRHLGAKKLTQIEPKGVAGV